MTLDEILTLVKAGYTKEEISALETPAAQPAEQSAEQPKETPAAQPAGQPKETPAAQQNEILEALNRLTNSLISKNINQTITQPVERTPEDALAEIIAPPRPKAH